MPWVVGIDEAGYGPNLGPFVMTSVACRVPAELAGADLWQALRTAVRKHGEADDDRLLVADSKRVFSPNRGLLSLESGVLAALPAVEGSESFALNRVVDRVCPAAHLELEGECWYTGSTVLPHAVAVDQLAVATSRLRQASLQAGITWGQVHSAVVCPARFNRITEKYGTKGAVLGEALAELLQAHQTPDAAEDVRFLIDKHGGRNNYAPMLQNALAEGMVVAVEEGRDRSVYRVLGLPRDVRLVFEPRADAGHFCVALASMVSKYLRELLMGEFNRFWRTHVPELKPTAGYPGDAARFFDAIRPTMDRLGIDAAAVWRSR